MSWQFPFLIRSLGEQDVEISIFFLPGLWPHTHLGQEHLAPGWLCGPVAHPQRGDPGNLGDIETSISYANQGNYTV